MFLPLPWPRTEEDGTPRGVDLAVHHLDVRRLTLARFRVLPPGIDRDDLVAEVLLAIARKNHQPCAYDPRLAGLGKYVNKVAPCILANMLAKAAQLDRLIDNETGSGADMEDERPMLELERFEHVDHEAVFGGEEHEELWERALRTRREEQSQVRDGRRMRPPGTSRSALQRHRAKLQAQGAAAPAAY
jgi:hypothetical protein